MRAPLLIVLAWSLVCRRWSQRRTRGPARSPPNKRDKATSLAPREPPLGRETDPHRAQDDRAAAGGLLSVFRQRLQRRRLHARRRATGSSPAIAPTGTSPGCIRSPSYKLIEAGAASPGHWSRPSRSARPARAGAMPRRSPITGSASTARPSRRGLPDAAGLRRRRCHRAAAAAGCC